MRKHVNLRKMSIFSDILYFLNNLFCESNCSCRTEMKISTGNIRMVS